MNANLLCNKTVLSVTAASSHVTSPAVPVPSQTHVISPSPPKQLNLPETIKQLEQQIAFYGSGPYSPQHQEELSKLNTLLYKAKVELQNLKQSITSSAVVSPDTAASAVPPAMLGGSAQSMSARGITMTTSSSGGCEPRVLDKRRLQELVKEVDPLEQMDDEVEEVLLQIADDFIESVVTNACHLAKHRKSNTLEAKDVQLHLERNWNMWIPGFGSDELRPYKRAATTEAHKQRMALIKKTLKKY